MKLRNKKVAVSRWKKVHDKEKEYINKNNIKHLKARILGYIAGDGNISIRKSKAGIHHDLRFFPDHISMIKAFDEAFIKVYDKKPIVKKYENFYQMRIYSKPIVLDLLDYAEFGIHNWNVPKNILINKKCKREWIRAFFDAEAYVGRDHIKVHSVNKKGLEEIKSMLLRDFGIISRLYEYKPKNPNHSTQYPLMILSKEMRKRYLDKIGFNHKAKIAKLRESLLMG